MVPMTRLTCGLLKVLRMFGYCMVPMTRFELVLEGF